MSNGLENGDTVQLKSGGPVMTIDTIATDNGQQGATCSWFDDDNRIQKRWFPLTSLNKVDV